MKFSIDKFSGRKTVMKVREAISKGRNIYRNTKGHENDINEVLIDLPDEKTGFHEHIVCMNTLYPGKVNGEFKMMRGHLHSVEEVYIMLKGKGYMILGKKRIPVKRGDLVTIPKNVWHRTVNTGKEKVVFLTIFQKHGQSHLKSY